MNMNRRGFMELRGPGWPWMQRQRMRVASGPLCSRLLAEAYEDPGPDRYKMRNILRGIPADLERA